MDEADKDDNSNIAVPTTSATSATASPVEQDLLSSDIFSADIFTSLMACAQTPNMALKEILFRLCTRVLSKVLRALEMDNDVLSLQEVRCCVWGGCGEELCVVCALCVVVADHFFPSFLLSFFVFFLSFP
jgi:hypothetical protein